MSTDEVYEIIDKEIEMGSSLEEIYVKYDNLYIEELNRPLKEQDEQKKNEYIKIRDGAGRSIVVEALLEKGYEIVPGTTLNKWRKRGNNE